MTNLRSQPLSAFTLAVTLSFGLASCVTTPTSSESSQLASPGPVRGLDDLVLVDCRLPSQIRQLGSRMTYLGPRRTVKTTQSDCGIRGGEFILFDRSDYKTALTTLLPKAEAGDAIAQTYVGEIYEKGLGLPAPDPARAAFWYRKAAASGHRPAQTNLGTLYERGFGVGQDRAVALDWYRRGLGLDKDRVVFESTLTAEREAFRRELALRNKVAVSIEQQLRRAKAERTASRSAKSPLAGTAQPPHTKTASVADAPSRPATVDSGIETTSAQEPILPQVAAVELPDATLPVSAPAAVTAITLDGVAPEQLRRVADSQRREADSEADRMRRELHAIEQLKQSEDKNASEASPRAAQLGKLELTRNEQFSALIDTSRRLTYAQ